MQLNRKIGHLMFAIMSLLMVLNLAAMSSASAHAHANCPAVQSSGHSDQPHQDTQGAAVCCTVASCCPLLPQLVTPMLPPALKQPPYAIVKVDTPLLLVRAIDPPPRHG